MGNNLAEQQQNWGAVSLGFIGVVSLRPAVGLAGWGLVGAGGGARRESRAVLLLPALLHTNTLALLLFSDRNNSSFA